MEIHRTLISRGVETWTLDIDPQAERWGVPGHHVVGDAREIDRISALPHFHCVIFNGVLGFGINEPDDIRRALGALGRLLPPAGILILGWNAGGIEDPRELPEFSAFFRYAEAFTSPTRVEFPDSSHIYDVLERVCLDSSEAW